MPKRAFGEGACSIGRYLYHEGTVYIILAVLIVFFTLFNPVFLTSRNLYNLITQSTYIIIAGMGICFVMISGGIDLSVGNQMAVCGCVAGIIMTTTELPYYIVWPVCIALGFAMGLLNGVISAKLKLFPLVVTIATSEVFKGIAYTITSSKSYSGMPAAFRALYKTKLFNLPLDVYLMLIIVAATWLVLNKTHFGRDVLAIGGNKECARLSGIKADLVQSLCFAITGAIFAVATLDMLAQQNMTSATTGPGTEITCLTAAIIGGISMKGGKGNVLGMVAGILIMQMISNGMQLAGWGSYTQYTVKGLILIAAIAFDALKNRPKPVVRVHKDPGGPGAARKETPCVTAEEAAGGAAAGMLSAEGKELPPVGRKPRMADVSRIRRKQLDIPYGAQSQAQRLDLYFPDEGEGPFPTLIYIHGGGFALGDKRDDHLEGYLGCLEHGWALAAVEYRLSGEAVFPAAVLDCRRAVGFLRQNAARYGLDSRRFAAIGGSAGGNLAAMLGMNIERFMGEDEPADASVCAAVDQFGPIDFMTMDDQARANGISLANHSQPDSPESQYIGAPVGQSAARCAQANPLTYASELMAPILVQHGTADRLVPFGQSVQFVRVLKEKGLGDRVTFTELEGAGHEDKRFMETDNLAIVFDFLVRHFK